MSRRTFLGYLRPLGNPLLPLLRIGWEVLGDQWYGMVSHKSHKGCTVRCWIFEQPVKSDGCSSILLFFMDHFSKCAQICREFFFSNLFSIFFSNYFFSFIFLNYFLIFFFLNFFFFIFFESIFFFPFFFSIFFS